MISTEQFFIKQLQTTPQNVDAICNLAKVRSEMKYETDFTSLLTNFLEQNEEVLTEEEKAKVYTNLAYFHQFSKETREYLLKAERLSSPFAETYFGLGLDYFNGYYYDGREEDLRISLAYFKKASELSTAYEVSFGLAVALYESKDWEKAKEILEGLISEFPNRMRLFLALSYCEANLGNTKKALDYLKKVRIGKDRNYFLETDRIVDYEVFDAYYVLEEYKKFLKLAEEAKPYEYDSEWDYFYYILTITKAKRSYFYTSSLRGYSMSVEDKIKFIKDIVLHGFLEKEKSEIIIQKLKEKQKVIDEKIETIHTWEKPEVKLRLLPEYACFFVSSLKSLGVGKEAHNEI